MFTGLIETLGTIESVTTEPPGKRLCVRLEEAVADVSIGDSVAVNGCCLTVIERSPATVVFEAGPETLQRTNLDTLANGAAVNIERSLRLGDPVGGHLVTGHVDGIGHLAERHDEGRWSTCWFQNPPHLAQQMASKGSIAIDGVSLTLVDVKAASFSVALIPHTLEVTTLGRLGIGDKVNLETDLLAKYVERQLKGEPS